MPKISVIVPVYKVESYIHRCVDSILHQTFTDFECILVDDGSPDNCGKICDEYAEKDKRVVVIHKKNGGLSDARNAGIDWAFENSDSEWLTFIDSDDWVHSRYLELLFNAVSQYKVLLSSCGHRRVNDENIEDADVSKCTVDVDSPENILTKGYLYSEYNYGISWGRLYKKDLFKNIRYPFGRLHEDEFVTYKLIYDCSNIAVMKNPLYYYFQNDFGIMSSHLTPKKINDKLEGLKSKVDFFYNNNYPISFNKALSLYASNLGSYLSKYKDDKHYSRVLENHIENIRQIKKNYYCYLPPGFKNYSYRAWINGKAFKKENFKNDVKNICHDKGPVYAGLWALKNYFGI